MFSEELKEAESESASDDKGESSASKDTGPKSLADGEKAPVDLFKAVFQDSDDSEDSDSDSSDEEQVTGTDKSISTGMNDCIVHIGCTG
mgnify:FL=1